MSKYPDFIRFKDVVGIRQRYCRITNIHDGLIYAIIDDKEHIIPTKSIIIIIRDAENSKKISDDWDQSHMKWRDK